MEEYAKLHLKSVLVSSALVFIMMIVYARSNVPRIERYNDAE